MTVKVVEVVPRMADLSSGPSLSVPSLCLALDAAGVDTSLMALEPRPAKLMFEKSQFFPSPSAPFAARLGVSSGMRKALTQAARSVDIIHTHSLWMMPNVYPYRATRGTDCKMMISPRGTLSPWARSRSKFRKWIVWQLGQREVLCEAACVHVTSEEEFQEVRALNKQSPIAIVPNGVACPDAVVDSVKDSERRTVLFLARIHPKKGIDILLETWRELESSHPDWDLKIAGPVGHAFADKMVELSKALALQNVTFLGEVRGEAKEATYKNADLYVLPTHSENFGISVAEALAHGLPAIVSEGAPWAGLEDQDAGWWIPRGKGPLLDALRTAMKLSDADRVRMGLNGHRWMKEQFDWTVVGRRMAAVYRWVANGGTLPADVVV